MLIENDQNLEQLQLLSSQSQERETSQLRSFADENEKLKKQMFTIDKQYRNLEAQLADEQDATHRAKREGDVYRKKYQEANSEKLAAFQSLESYQ